MTPHGFSTKGGIGAVVLAAMIAAAVLAPLLAPFDPNDQDIMNGLAAPLTGAEGGGAHVFGTNRLGEDVLSRIIFGARVSLTVAFAAVAVSGLIGSTLGCLAGFAGPRLQSIVLVATDTVLSIPFVLLALALIAAIGPSITSVIIALVIVRWAQFARLGYTLTLEVRERDFILACRAIGASAPRTILRHVLPNIGGPLLVVATLELAYAILAESGLSFLGLGVPPEIPSWGGMLQEGLNEIDTAWWLTTTPGIAIMLTAIGFNFLGDWLRDRLDPGLQQSLR